MATFVKKFGVELEGGWDERPPDADRFVHDGSVQVPGSFRVGEIPSPVFSHIGHLRRWMFANYPDHVGATCGLHVHASFGARNLSAIAALADSEDFERFLLEKLAQWGRRRKVQNRNFWARLRGENTYCKKGYSLDHHAEYFCGEDRYRVVNFCALRKRGTIEIRVLAAFVSPKLAVAAVRRILSIIEAYLRMRYLQAMEAATIEAPIEVETVETAPVIPEPVEVEL